MTRHRFDVFSFLAGAVALTVAALVLVADLSIRLVDLRVIGPVVVLAMGLALLFGGRQRERDDTLVAGEDDHAAPGTVAFDEDPASLDDDLAWHEVVSDEVEPDEPRTATQRIEPDEVHTERVVPDEPRTSTQRIEPDEVHTERIEPDER